jgi:CRISPR-associated protein Csx10
MTTPTKHLTLRFKLLSAATFGRGDGVPGLVDAEVEHDDNGLPFLRGRTLRGLLSEEMESLLYALGAERARKWELAKGRLLGTTGRTLNETGNLHVGDATLPERVRNLIAATIYRKSGEVTPTTVLEAMTGIRRQTAMTHLGAPEAASLRALRVILRETKFEARLTFDEEPQPLDLALLTATVLAWRRAGTGRNRGRGRLKAWLENEDWTSNQFKIFGQELTSGSSDSVANIITTQATQSISPMDGNATTTGCDGEMRAVRYTIELKQPVLATDVQGDPNGAISMPHVPGSLLRGALVGRYLQANGKRELDALNDSEERALFLDEQTRYLNAYPINDEGRRALPVPAAWFFEKTERPQGDNDERPVYNLAWSRPRFSKHTKPTDEETAQFHEESISAPFLWLDGGTASLWKPPRQLNVHTRRDARLGRATEGGGDIFRYDALAAGTRLQGIILTTKERAAKIEALLQEATLWIGRARRAGYGEATVTEDSVEVLDYWREAETDESANPVDADGEFRVMFTSDSLLRDEWGQATLDPRAALEAELGLQPQALTLVSEYSFAKSKIVGGFNRKWGLPLPQTVALAAGSVFAYHTKEALSTNQFEALERQGIGERCGEGFGRLLVNWLANADWEITSQRAAASLPSPIEKLSAEETALVQVIAERLLRRRLDERLREQVNRIRLKSPLPHKNQLARLRVILRDVQKGRKPDQVVELRRLHEYLKRLRGLRVGEQFERARVERGDTLEPLLNWLQAQLDDPQKEWSSISVTLGEPVKANEVLAQEYALRLVDQVLYRATKSTEESQ